MDSPSHPYLFTASATGIIRLRLMVKARWIAICGQLVALVSARYLLEIPLAIEPCLVVLGVSVICNAFLMLRQDRYPFLRNRGATALLGLDTVVIGLLLYFTGVLTNPFASMLLAPMLVAATLLSLRSVVLLTSLGIAGLSVFLFYSKPLWPEQVSFPPIFIVGEYLALVVAAIFLVIYIRRVARESRRLFEALSQSRMELEREQKISALGALAAAVAHELGSPLSTIAIIAGEMKRDLENTDSAEDVCILQQQVARCRSILENFSRHNVLADRSIERVPLLAFLDYAVSPYRRDNIECRIALLQGDGHEPQWPLQTGLMHGVANILQNAIAFARRQVICEVTWRGEEVTLRVLDDGPGFPPALLPQLGQAYISGRDEEDARAHMGLGLFIAKTLLERSGANVNFANQTRADGSVSGASVTMSWRYTPHK